MSRELRALEHGTRGRHADREALRRLFRLFWHDAERPLRLRIVGTAALLGAMALINALVPLLFARAVDALTAGG